MRNKSNGIAKSIPQCSRTFRCWLVEVRMLARKFGYEGTPNLTQLKYYYDGGYSPKVAVGIELNVDIS